MAVPTDDGTGASPTPTSSPSPTSPPTEPPAPTNESHREPLPGWGESKCWQGNETTEGQPLNHSATDRDEKQRVDRDLWIDEERLAANRTLFLTVYSGWDEHRGRPGFVVGFQGITTIENEDDKTWLRVHVETRRGDAMSPGPSSPELRVTLAQPLTAGSYAIDACLENVTVGPAIFYNDHENIFLNFTVS